MFMNLTNIVSMSKSIALDAIDVTKNTVVLTDRATATAALYSTIAVNKGAQATAAAMTRASNSLDIKLAKMAADLIARRQQMSK